MFRFENGFSVDKYNVTAHAEVRSILCQPHRIFEGTPGNPDHPGRTELSLSSDEGVLLAFEVRNHLTPDFTLGAGAWHYTAASEAPRIFK